MKKNYSRIGTVLLVALLLISGCTRAKSSGPDEPTATGSGAQAATQPSGGAATNTPSGSRQDEIAITTTAWAAQTATAAAAGSQETVTLATNTPTPVSEAPTATPKPADSVDSVVENTPTPTPKPEATQAVGQEKTHTVKAGENLFRIALSYGLSTQELAAYNKIANPNIVYLGQVLKIPGSGQPTQPPTQPPGVHIVQSGENLFRVALKYNMAYTRLASANGLSYPYTIYVGQRLVIP